MRFMTIIFIVVNVIIIKNFNDICIVRVKNIIESINDLIVKVDIHIEKIDIIDIILEYFDIVFEIFEFNNVEINEI